MPRKNNPDKKNTTIVVRRETRDKLCDMKFESEESFNSVIKRLIAAVKWQQHKFETELKEQNELRNF